MDQHRLYEQHATCAHLLWVCVFWHRMCTQHGLQCVSFMWCGTSTQSGTEDALFIWLSMLLKKKVWLWGLALDCCLSMWPVALFPGSVLGCSKTLFPRRSLGVFQGMVYSRDNSWKTTVDENGSGLSPSIIQTLQCRCSRLGTLSQPAVPSQAPWELQYIPCF